MKVTDKSKKVYTPFPPPREKSKVDEQIESGEYFLGKQAKERAKREERMRKQRERQEEREKERKSAFVAPRESLGLGGEQKKKKKKRREHLEDGSRKLHRGEKEAVGGDALLNENE